MKKLLSLILIAMLCLPGQIVQAAGEAAISMKADAVEAGAENWNVSCQISGTQEITNGKIRITYDSKQLKLLSSEVGQALEGVNADINDPLQGTKEEGEILLVFASASKVKANGSLLNLVFALDESVKDGDILEIQAAVEELGCDGEDLNSKSQALSLTVGSSGTGGSGSQPESQSESESESDRQNNSGQNGQQNGGNSGNGSTGNGSGTGNEGGSGSQSSTGSQNNSSKTASQVKTGDTTMIWFPAGMAILAGMVLIVALASKKKKNI